MGSPCPGQAGGRLLLLAVLAVVMMAPVGNGTMFDPCADVVPAGRGDAFPVGVALVPHLLAKDLEYLLGNWTNPLKMCDPQLQTELVANYSAALAVYNMKIDRMQVLRIPFPDLLYTVNSSATLVGVVFRKNVFSSPVYMFSANSNATKGAGYVISLALLLNFKQGILQHLLWYDLTCNSCGGKSSQLCVQQVDVNSCATSFLNCTCTNTSVCNITDSQFDKCSTSINTGFSGSDVNDAVFNTGQQIKRLNAFSITSLYYNVKDSIMSQYNAIYGDITGQWDSQQQERQAQLVEFQGGLGRQSSGSIKSTTSPPPPPPSPPAAPPPPPSPPPPPGFGGGG